MEGKKMSAQKGVSGVIAGFVTVLVGMYLASPLATATTSANTSLASYTGAQAVINIIPTIFAIGLMIAGVVLMILGALAIKS